MVFIVYDAKLGTLLGHLAHVYTAVLALPFFKMQL